ncbi:hypothetical protein QTJ16_004643 [Diplocarpon rosae]|uniref:GPI ethanolamine phosphate transferase 1 n=1 Tax=Diplocarpon rosae TaxID=946125 RepID=A0AAD9SZC1_9HELO|nr:hypothetical protein QTJ16_004643 [Diplocarpon rosae]
MARVNRFGFLAIALAFHLVYIYSIFDIYFVSPIVSGMREFGVQRPEGVEAPATRLVLFVGDGLRADKAFQSFPEPHPNDDADLVPRPLAPFLRSRVLDHGTFGVSHTRVPTESRPGHVALIAGLYEDVSAVTTGWKLNPVNFDSVFNRSRHTWSWGSPDILPMFQLGAVEGRVDAETYSAEEEDFSQEASGLDIWVFEKVKALFQEAAKNATLDVDLRKDKNVFFLHLLGLDTNGHAFRPYSPEYLNNIKVVDQGVQEISKLIEDFYGDDRTAFVFTADHGMSDYGSHGDGHPDNTRTPLIAWGSGVAKPVTTSEGTIAPGHDRLSSDWGLDQVHRHDVAQADVAALMAYLAGLDFPVNSVGELPLSYLSGDIAAKSEAFLANARGILEMYRVKEEQKKATELRYRPFKALGDEQRSIDHQFTAIQNLVDSGNHEEAIRETAILVKTGLDGIRYLQTYDWLFLRALITIGYLGWIAFALTTVIDLHVLHGKTETSRTLVVLPLLMPFLHRLQPNNHYLHRLMVIFLTFAPIFVLLTISYEGLFYLGFCSTLITWVRLEHCIYISATGTNSISKFSSESCVSSLPPSIAPSTPFRALTLSDLRTSLFFLTLLQSAFFSTGNIASVSAFSLSSVSRLIPIFDPFSQGSLLILKLLIPFALISANLGILNKRLGVAPSALFMVVMAVSDGLTLHFFWVVKDEGSWLEIGSTISHFVIASLVGVFVLALEGGGGVLVGEVDVDAQIPEDQESSCRGEPKKLAAEGLKENLPPVNGNTISGPKTSGISNGDVLRPVTNGCTS